MPAYFIALTEITDSAGMEQYRDRVGPLIAQHGGRVVAAGPPVVLEGDTAAQLAVIIEFPSLEQGHAWYNAPDYQELKALRQRSTRAIGVFVDGLPDQ